MKKRTTAVIPVCQIVLSTIVALKILIMKEFNSKIEGGTGRFKIMYFYLSREQSVDLIPLTLNMLFFLLVKQLLSVEIRRFYAQKNYKSCLTSSISIVKKI
jgi:hypothetical protein